MGIGCPFCFCSPHAPGAHEHCDRPQLVREKVHAKASPGLSRQARPLMKYPAHWRRAESAERVARMLCPSLWHALFPFPLVAAILPAERCLDTSPIILALLGPVCVYRGSQTCAVEGDECKRVYCGSPTCTVQGDECNGLVRPQKTTRRVSASRQGTGRSSSDSLERRITHVRVLILALRVPVRNAEPEGRGCHQVLEWNAMPRRANAEAVLSSTQAPCHATPRHTMQCHATLAMPFMPCLAMPFMPCHAMPCHAM